MKHSKTIKSIAASACCAWATATFGLISMPAAAHITLEYQAALAGSYYKATFKVGHGCGASPIRQIVVNIPAGVEGAKPMPKPGWAIDIAQGKLEQPVMRNGKSVTEDVARISWTARSPADYLQGAWYDEFVLQGKMPASAGTLYWAVSQVCEDGRVDWIETPKPGQPPHELKYPAAVLELMPASGGGHQH